MVCIAHLYSTMSNVEARYRREEEEKGKWSINL
jgi:hypothetical protein